MWIVFQYLRMTTMLLARGNAHCDLGVLCSEDLTAFWYSVIPYLVSYMDVMCTVLLLKKFKGFARGYFGNFF